MAYRYRAFSFDILDAMWFMVKILFYLAIVVVGGMLTLNSFPSLKANIIEVVNPRVQEAQLLEDLEQHLDDAAALLPEAGELVSDEQLQEGYRVLQEAQEVLDEITTINQENSGMTRNLITRALDAIIPGGADPTPTPTPVPSDSDGQATCAPVASPVPCIP